MCRVALRSETVKITCNLPNAESGLQSPRQVLCLDTFAGSNLENLPFSLRSMPNRFASHHPTDPLLVLSKQQKLPHRPLLHNRSVRFQLESRHGVSNMASRIASNDNRLGSQNDCVDVRLPTMLGNQVQSSGAAQRRWLTVLKPHPLAQNADRLIPQQCRLVYDLVAQPYVLISLNPILALDTMDRTSSATKVSPNRQVDLVARKGLSNGD